MSKTIKINEETRIKLNLCKSEILKNNPNIKKITDDITINELCEEYLYK